MENHSTKLAATCLSVACVLACASAQAQEPQALSDKELEHIVAGNSLYSLDELAHLEFVRTTRAGTSIDVEGTMALTEGPGTINLGTLSLSDNAQSGLRSLLNINAVNSEVNVLLNLNISVNSNIETINQSNLNSRIINSSLGK